MLSLPAVEFGSDNVRIASYVAIPLVCMGLICNGIMMRLMIKQEVRQFSSSTFLLCLAITDTIVLIYEVMDDIAVHIDNFTGYEILFGYNQWRCRFGVFFYQTARTISAWLVVAMAAELCLASTGPRRRKVVYYKNRALYVSMAIVLVAIAAGFPFLVLAQKGSPEDEIPSCTSVYNVFFIVYSEFVLKGATHFVVPVIFIAVCNVISFLAFNREKTPSSGYGASMDRFVSQHDLDRRGSSLQTKVQAANTIYMVTILYILAVSPATIAELMIWIGRFLGDFNYTADWSLAVNATGVIFLANYALKFLCIVVVGKDYRAAMAGKMMVWADEEEDTSANSPPPTTNGAVANGGSYFDVRNPSEIQLNYR